MAKIEFGRGFVTRKHARHSRTFADAAGEGATGDVTIFTVTGRVLLHTITAFCTDGLSEGGATATVQLGTAAVDGALIAVVNAVDIDTNEWWTDGTPVAEIDHLLGAQIDAVISSNIVVLVSTQAVSGGTIIFDAIYTPITDNGALA